MRNNLGGISVEGGEDNDLLRSHVAGILVEVWSILIRREKNCLMGLCASLLLSWVTDVFDLGHMGLVVPIRNLGGIDHAKRPLLYSLADGTPEIDRSPAVILGEQLLSTFFAQAGSKSNFSVGGVAINVSYIDITPSDLVGHNVSSILNLISETEFIWDDFGTTRDFLQQIGDLGHIHVVEIFVDNWVSLAFGESVAVANRFVCKELVTVSCESWLWLGISDIFSHDGDVCRRVDIGDFVREVDIWCLAIFSSTKDTEQAGGGVRRKSCCSGHGGLMFN